MCVYIYIYVYIYKYTYKYIYILQTFHGVIFNYIGISWTIQTIQFWGDIVAGASILTPTTLHHSFL